VDARNHNSLRYGHRSHAAAAVESQALVGVPSSVHGPFATIGHSEAAQAPGRLQPWSQAHDAVQSSAPQAFGPTQSTSHAPRPHWILGHARSPMQVMSQSPPAVQSIAPHGPAVEQKIVQSKPAGQTTWSHDRPNPHSISQV